ncbi:MAG: hypothetical protein JO151_17020 [Verrucomicrobia bacterium]|nr:hypothetical protein [Verrucomicrobiota bacterium]
MNQTNQQGIAALSLHEATFDAVTLTSSRVSSNSVVSKQLVAQSQPGIEEFLTDELGQAIATEVDRCVVNFRASRRSRRGYWRCRLTNEHVCLQ